MRKGFVKDFYSDRDKTISSSGIIPILLNMRSYYYGWVANAGKTDMLHETIDLETATGYVFLVHDDPEVSRKEFELLMCIEEKYPDLLHSDTSLFLPPEDPVEITPEIRDALLEANAYNREILELLKEIGMS